MKCLVTGGGGFLGSAVVKQLVERGDTVRTFQRGDYPELAGLGVEGVRGDLSDAEALCRAAAGLDAVFHVAANPGVWGPYKDFHVPNVVGTQNVISACKVANVPRLIFTSSPSVVFDGSDESNITRSRAPIHEAFIFAHYPKTKAMAEKLVMAASSETLATISLRPHLIWGPGDPHLVPRILARARSGRLSMIGKRKNLVDSTYIDNAALAHVLAADRLASNASCAGKVDFISNGETDRHGEFNSTRILAAAGLDP